MNRQFARTFNSEVKCFSYKNIHDFKDIGSYHKYRTGQIIFYEGHLPYGIFILTSGEVEIKYGNSKTERVKSPAFLGISAFLNNIAYSGTVKADSNCEIYFLSTSVYQNLKNNKHPVAHLFSQIN
jgi:CRP-like cAMP-binding protein